MVSYKATNNEIIEQGCCVYIRDNLCDAIHHYITVYKLF